MQPTLKLLNIDDHSRDSIGMKYIYPVVSRRSGGVSVGINLNPNNACNWRCIYCQVPELKRGTAPVIDLISLEVELRTFLQEVLYGDFMQNQVPAELRRINDIALSGNGEPTSAKEFEQVIELIGRVRSSLDLPRDIKLVLITNGSLIDRDNVQAGLSRMSEINGEVWFKLDSVTRSGRALINNTRMSLNRMRANLLLATSLCPTWLQSCMFQIDDMPLREAEVDAYLRFVAELLRDGAPLKGVMIYGLARTSMQPESPRLTKVSQGWMESLGAEIQAMGLEVKISP